MPEIVNRLLDRLRNDPRALATIIEQWQDAIRRSESMPSLLIDRREQDRVCRQFLENLAEGLAGNPGAGIDDAVDSIEGEHWTGLRSLLREVSATHAKAGYSPSQTAKMVLLVKRPLCDSIGDDSLAEEARWPLQNLIDRWSVFTTDVFLQTRESLIVRQREELIELSTPVIRLWDGVLAVPLIGTLDSERTQVMMEALLTRIVETEAHFAIVDITGVPTVDTLVAQHLLKTVAAARLMGADCIISGISAQIAQTIVQLGVELGDVLTKPTLQAAFAEALRRLNSPLVSHGVRSESPF